MTKENQIKTIRITPSETYSCVLQSLSVEGIHHVIEL